MSTYTTPAPNLVATLWGPLGQIIAPLLDHAPDPADPGVPELLAALGDALTAAVRVTRAIPAVPASIPPRPAAVRAPAARVTTAQVGSVAGEPKPGSLRARLITHLAAHPGQAFTATELFHALGATSGGAVGAALNTMTAHGEAIQISDSPKRYTAPTAATTPAPATPPPDDDADQDDAPAKTADADTTAPGTEAEAAPAADANTDAPVPDANDTRAGNGADQAAPQSTDAPAPRAPRARKTTT